MSIYMVIDVESIGLHGEGWQVGYIVVDATTGQRYDEDLFTCSPEDAAGWGSPRGQATDRRWLAENAPVTDGQANCANPAEVRAAFWQAWLHFKAEGAILAADVCWPVEARFLIACVEDHGDPWAGPYPLIDIASVRLGAGLDPMATVERLPDEMPAHNALTDARQSARLLVEALSDAHTGNSEESDGNSGAHTGNSGAHTGNSGAP
jgi:hypothetical protein